MKFAPPDSKLQENAKAETASCGKKSMAETAGCGKKEKAETAGRGKNSKAYGTGSSQAVPHPSTVPARRCLTSVIERERVLSSWCGRKRLPTPSTDGHFARRHQSKADTAVGKLSKEKVEVRDGSGKKVKRREGSGEKVKA